MERWNKHEQFKDVEAGLSSGKRVFGRPCLTWRGLAEVERDKRAGPSGKQRKSGGVSEARKPSA